MVVLRRLSGRRRRAIDDRRKDTRPQEGEGSDQTDVPFALSLPFDNFGEGGNAAEPDGLGKRGHVSLFMVLFNARAGRAKPGELQRGKRVTFL